MMTAVAGAVWFLAVALLLGGAAGSTSTQSRETERRLLRLWWVAATTALLAGVTTLFLEARELADSAGVVWSDIVSLLRRTRFGHVWVVEHAVLAVTLVSLVAARGRLRRLIVVGGSVLALVAAPFASHSAGGESATLTIAVHAVHLVAFALWLGGLGALAAATSDRLVESDSAMRIDAARAIGRFSRRAPFFIAAIFGTGLVLGRVHVGRWPALLATPYGITLIAKLAVFAAALALASALRWRTLPAALATGEGPSFASLRRQLFAEAVCGALAVLAAARLADTVPGAHDTVSWWLPFRFSIRATWALPWVPERVGFGIALFVFAVTIGAGLLRQGARRRAVATLALGASVAAAIALPAIAVPAFSGTYWTPEVPYHAISVANGRKLYREHCVRCHGEAGRGDGPLAREQPKPPANLTEPHTADHTAGDMFWWLTHGIDPSGMPPFADVLSPDERWDLVNYLRAFAAGYQGRILGSRISPGRPWLGAIDFNYRLESGERGLLRDFRGKSVALLVLFTPGSSDARLARLRDLLPEIRRAGGDVLAVPTSAAGSSSLAPLPVVAGGAEEVVESYRLLRRTFADPGNDGDDDRPPHLELLIDRFGYVRARWRPDLESPGWSDERLLLEQIALLAREPQILPSPDDHVH